MDTFKKYAIANIKDLRVEMMLEYVHHELVPKLMTKRENDRGCLFDDKHSNNCKMDARLRFPIQETGEAFFVDGHERPETLKYRPAFTKEYLGYEIRAHRWLQMTLELSNVLLSEGKIAPYCGYNYTTSNSVDMVEYHIDTSYAFEERLKHLPFGGNLSIRKSIDSKTVIFVGQDKAIFKRFLFLYKMWVGPNGERALLPKDEGTGMMISTFISREHGLIREITSDVLAQVTLRRAGEQCADQDAAIEIYGSPDKRPLTLDKSPFLVFFEYGENKEGYWAYSNMVLQFEDAVDILKIMHPSYDFVFLFDHSSGHAKQRPDGLNQHGMNRAFGGKSAPMQNTIITQEEGFLGPFPHTLEPGDTQRLVFSSSDTGPFWMCDAEKEDCRLDKHLGNTNRIQLKAPELILSFVRTVFLIQDSLLKAYGSCGAFPLNMDFQPTKTWR